ncbi:putative mucin-associated surface protein (MASP) [Trypanosoma cruzi]|nr:putative mucin-associated surface protein (MASP) [Trypanosoma cruzi]
MTTTFSSRRCGDDYPHITGELCWRNPGEPSAGSDCLGRAIATHHPEYNRKRIIKPTEKASAAIITDASLRGWGAVFIPDSGDVEIAGGNGRRNLFSSRRPRRARYAWPYRLFPPSFHPPITIGWTTLRCKERRIKAAGNRTP